MSKQKEIENDLIGKKFGRLTVESYSHKEKKDNSAGFLHYYNCICECGNKYLAERNSLKYGNTKSCGCIHKEQLIKRNKDAAKLCGDSIKYKRLHNIYSAMIDRCYSKNNKKYNNYGGRGIVVCGEWLNDWNCFKNWALINGYSDELTIDRINVDENYEPNNCRWATNKEQANNKTNNKYLEYNGEVKTLSEWCDELNLPYHTIKARLNKLGMTVEEAFNTPKQWKEYSYGEGVEKIGNKLYLTYNNKTLTVNEWVKELNLDCSHELIPVRARKGWPAKKILETPIDFSKKRY